MLLIKTFLAAAFYYAFNSGKMADDIRALQSLNVNIVCSMLSQNTNIENKFREQNENIEEKFRAQAVEIEKVHKAVDSIKEMVLAKK